MLDASETRIDKNREDIKYNDAKIDKLNTRIDKLKVEIKEKEGNKSKLY